MPSPEARELALLLVRKAEGDESVLDRVLDDPDEQAVEKRLKAVLALHEVDYDRTHSISYLSSVLEQHGVELPPGREQIEELTPWAVAGRYDDSIEEVLDRGVARKLVADVREWSDSLVAKPE